MTLKNVVSPTAPGGTADTAGAPMAVSAKAPIPEHPRPEETGSPTVTPLPVSREVSVIPRRENDPIVAIILAAWGTARWCARIPRTFEEQRAWMNR